MIAAFVGGRSDGGILAPLVERLNASVISPVLVIGDSELSIARSAGLTCIEVANELESHRPDMFVVLGDRYEALAAATAAYHMGVPICHLHGGEVTLGSRDDGHRNAITQLADMHLTSTFRAAERVIMMGKGHGVHVIGAIGAHNARTAVRATIDEPLVIVACPADYDAYAACMLATQGMNRLVIGGNADLGSSGIEGVSLEPAEFLSLLGAASVIVGNSSAGIIEAPSAGTWTVNVGDRQKGRERAKSVIDVGLDPAVIRREVQRCLRLPDPDFPNPYWGGDSVEAAALWIEAAA